MASRFSRVQRWVACALWCGVVGAAQAASSQPSGEEFLRMLPAERQALVKSWRAAAAARAASSATALDTTPPTLLAFDAGTSVDASNSLNELIVHLKLTDSSSGLRYAFVTATSMTQPQSVNSSVPVTFAANRFNGSTAFHLSGFAQSGPWRITDVLAYDLNGNRMELKEDQLLLMGNTQFTVTGGLNDTAAPVLLGGTILTPELSLSQPARGTADVGPVLKVQVRLRDPAGGPVSGIHYAHINLCTATQSTCIAASTTPETRYGLSNVERVMAQQVYPGTPVEDYLIHGMGIADQAGHYVYLVSKDFGGSTDFSTLFPSTTVKITP